MTPASRKFSVCLVLALFLISPQVLAQSQQEDGRKCAGADGASPDQQITACTRMIQTGYAQRVSAGLAGVLTLRGKGYARLGQLDRAFEDYQHALRLHPEQMGAVQNLGLLFCRKGQYKRAIPYFDQVISYFQRPGIQDDRNATSYTYMQRGLAKKRLGNNAGGDADVAHAKTLKPDISDKLECL
jgi:tetratricopeptide (TPR) repeat protein